MGKINFFQEDIDFTLPEKKMIRDWLTAITKAENKSLEEVNYIFTSDEYLLRINSSYLNHHYYTDVISFSHAETPSIIEGDIFISIERIKENAPKFEKTFRDELLRVMVHGLLHFIGYNDKSEEDKKTMTNKEDYYLNLFEKRSTWNV